MRILALRDHSERELREKLLRKGYSREEVEETVEKLRNMGYLNDRDFALKFAVEKRKKLFGRIKIEYELRRKGIEQAMVEEALKAAEQALSEEEAAKKLLSRRRGYPPEKNARYLLSRGFTWDTIKELVKDEGQ